MTKIQILKILRYDPTFKGKYDRFTGYNLSTKGKVDLPIENGQSYGLQDEVINTVFISEHLRAKQSGKTIQSTQRIELSDLNEVGFHLDRLVNRNEFQEYGSSLVRERFIQAFKNDSLIEQRSEIFGRIKSTMKLINKHLNQDLILISHSFFMKIMHAYIESEGELEFRTDLIDHYFDSHRKTFEFGSGFSLNDDNIKFIQRRYL